MYTKTFVNTMNHSLGEVQNETPRDTLHDVEAVASADTLADRLAEVIPRHVATNWPVKRPADWTK